MEPVIDVCDLLGLVPGCVWASGRIQGDKGVYLHKSSFDTFQDYDRHKIPDLSR